MHFLINLTLIDKEHAMNSTVKLHAPFDRLRSYDITPEIALRKGIIMQAILDACNSGKHRKHKAIRIEAKTWLFSNSEDFRQVCAEADLDPKLVVRIAKDEIKFRAALSKKSSSKRLTKNTKKKFRNEDICAIVRKYI